MGIFLWLPASITFQLCPIPNAQNQEPNPYKFISAWSYFSGVQVGTYANQYRIRAELTPISPSSVNLNCYVETLIQVNGENVWTAYTSFAQTMNEIPGRLKKYDSRGYQTNNLYVPISVSQNGGKGDVSAVTVGCGVVPYIERCGSACGLYSTTTGSFQGCANAIVFSKDDSFVPTPFLMGRNPSNCGSNLTSYCFCDQIILTSTSPVEGQTINNAWEGPNANDFVQVFGYIGATGEAVGAVQQLQIGTSNGKYLILKVINEGAIQVGELDTTTNIAIWGDYQIVEQGNPTILYVDRPDRYYYIYLFPFPNQDILPVCAGTSTTPYPDLPTSTTAYPYPSSTTTTSSTSCAPIITNAMPPSLPTQTNQKLLEKMAKLGKRPPCGCGQKNKNMLQ